MAARNRKKENKRFYRINERISAPSLRVLDPEGKQIGILTKFEALEKARELSLDLVEIAPMAKPPVVRIIDFNKFLYQEEKKKREEKRKAKSSETKEVRLGPFMDDHDLEVMANRARDFLTENNKVRLVVRFTGRQIAHPEFGQKVMDRVVDGLSDISKVERDRHFEGRQLIAMLAPDKKGTVQKGKKDEKEQEENQQIGS
ncbi:MAG: translation initiation factor IF-3 [Candidatus Levybacteria bacterium]|nr:translation initiation factor IF-3 [Candidatus Levybacteria bacterium]MBI2420832.1 translation initiation factor IF-3 [Candidatus Levybacteria bacterium]